MSTANRIVKNTGFLYAKMGITMFISLYTTRLILNSLGASDFGIFNIVGGAIAMLGFLNTAMASATQRFMSYCEGEGNKEKLKSIFNVSVILHLSISFVVGIILLIAGYFFFNGILNIPEERIFAAKVVYGSLIVSTIFTVMTVPYDAAMNAHENMKYYAIVGIFESLLKLGVAFACVYTTFDKLIVYGFLMACIPLITLTIMRVYCHRHYEECVIAPRVYWNKKLMKEMTSFAGWNFFATAATMISNYGLGILINIFYGVLLNTALGLAQQIDAQLKVFSNNMLKAINPIIVKKEGAKETQAMLKITMSSSKFSFFLFSFFVIPFLIETPYILKIWLKEIPEYAIIFCRMQLFCSLTGQLGATINSAIAASGKIDKFSLYSSLLYLGSLLLTYILFKNNVPPHYMYVSIFVLNVSIYRIIGIVILHKNSGLIYAYYIKNVIIPCVITASICFVISYFITFVLEESLIRLIITSIGSTIAFIICLSTIGTTKEEKEKIKYCFYSINSKIKSELHIGIR